MEPIVPAVERELLKSELRDEFFWRDTNKAGNKLYVMRSAEAPNIMREIGRLRELAFRQAGGGTGKSMDVDEYDLRSDGYRQLIVWDPVREEILGGYRFIIPRSSDAQCLSTEHYFEFSDKFRHEFLPYTIELGRSFVCSGNTDGGSLGRFYTLDNLWDGLGALMVRNPDIKYMFGKVTMYGDYNMEARNTLIYFLRKHFPDRDGLMMPRYPVEMSIDERAMGKIFTGEDYAADYKILLRSIRDFEENIPPLINSYMSLSPTMRVFGTAMNPDFGNVEETGILITLSDIYKAKVERHFANI